KPYCHRLYGGEPELTGSELTPNGSAPLASAPLGGVEVPVRARMPFSLARSRRREALALAFGSKSEPLTCSTARLCARRAPAPCRSRLTASASRSSATRIGSLNSVHQSGSKARATGWLGVPVPSATKEATGAGVSGR